MSQAWKIIRVFISSPFRDMHAERDHLVRFVFPRLREELLRRRIHFVDVDLRWGVSSDQDPVAICREVVDECRPRFICLLGGRYGDVKPGHDRSVTHEEVNYAVLDRVGRHGYAFFYFRDPAATSSIIEQQTGEFREPLGSLNETRLGALKEKITAAKLNPFIYQARWDNNQRRVTDLKAFGVQVYSDLLKSLKLDSELRDRWTDETMPIPDEFFEESAAMDAFVEERSERFVLGSREVVLNQLLAHADATGGPGYVCLTGTPGSGKSALLAYLSRHSIFKSPNGILLIGHFVGTSPNSTDVRHTLRRLCHELKRHCPDITAEIPDDLENLCAAFSAFLGQTCERRRVVILLDAINRFDVGSQLVGPSWLPEEIPPNARIVLSTADSPILQELRHRHRKPLEINLSPLTAADCEGIIEQFSRRYSKRLEPNQRAALVAKTDADTPLYLLAALEELRTLGKHEEIARRIVEFPPTTHELFLWILGRLQKDDGFRDLSGRPFGDELVSHFAALLAASRYGLSQHELTDLLDAGDPQGNVAALLNLLRPYLRRRGELLDFVHDQFRAAVQEKWLRTNTASRATHARLARYFDAQPFGRRKAVEVAWQLARAGEWRRLYDVLRNPEFFTAIWNNSQYEVQEYWVQIQQNSSLRMIEAYSTTDNSLLRTPIVWDVIQLFGRMGHFDQQKAICEAILDAARAARNNTILFQALNNAACVAGARGDYACAAGLFLEARGLNASLSNPRERIHLLYNLGVNQRAIGSLELAKSNLQEVVDVARDIGERTVLRRALEALGKIHLDQGDLGEAERLLGAALVMSREERHAVASAGILNALALLHQNQGALEAAAKEIDEVITIHERLGNRSFLPESLNNAGSIARQQGQPARAMIYFKQAERMANETAHKFQLAMSIDNQATILIDRGQLDRAQLLAERALPLFRDSGHREHLALCLNVLGCIHLKQNEFAEGYDFLGRAEAIFRSMGSIHLASCLYSKGVATLDLQQRSTEQLAEAAIDMVEAIHLFKTAQDSCVEDARFRMGEILVAIERDTAFPLAKVLHVSKALRDAQLKEIHIAFLKKQILRALDANNPSMAKNILDECVAVLDSQGTTEEMATLLHAFAETARDREFFELAKISYLDAITRWKDLNNDRARAAGICNYANVLADTGNRCDAIASYREAEEIYRREGMTHELAHVLICRATVTTKADGRSLELNDLSREITALARQLDDDYMRAAARMLSTYLDKS